MISKRASYHPTVCGGSTATRSTAKRKGTLGYTVRVTEYDESQGRLTHLALELGQLELLGERLTRPVRRSDGRRAPGGTAVHGVELADVRVGVACAGESASFPGRQSKPS
jgi:hypothetical protein